MKESNSDICCEFAEILNSSTYSYLNQIENASINDINSFITYCQLWQHKQCVCLFANDDLIEKFHSFISNWLNIAISVIEHLPDDCLSNVSHTLNDEHQEQQARAWSIENKEKLLYALVKIFSSNMPLYVTYKHLFFNNKDCCDSDTISMLQMYCQTQHQNSASSSHENDVPVELLRNICNFIEANGLVALKNCFSKATPDNLPISLAHLLFNIIFNIRVWLNSNVIVHHITSMRSLVIKYMCQLSDKDLRLAGTKNTTELMYNTFKDAFDQTHFKIDSDGLSLAYKYFTSSTLTIRLCGIAQMNSQINLWSEFNTSQQQEGTDAIERSDSNELADWFCDNKIIEHLYGPNLHVEVIKRSQDILNFLAYTNRLNEKHFDIIWQSAQLKHCSKPVLDMLIALHKHLCTEQLEYLTRLISQMDLSLHTEQTLQLSACLTKYLWSTMIDIQNKPKDTLVFQPLIQSHDHMLTSNDDQTEGEDDDGEDTNDGDDDDDGDDDELSVPNKITQRHNQSMDTQPQVSDDEETVAGPKAKIIPKKRRSSTRYVHRRNQDMDTEEEELYEALDVSTKKGDEENEIRKRGTSTTTEEDDDDENTRKVQHDGKQFTDEQSTSTSGSAIDDTVVLSQTNSDNTCEGDDSKTQSKTNRDLIKLLKYHDKQDEKRARKNLKRNHSSTQDESNDSTDVFKASPKNLNEFNESSESSSVEYEDDVQLNEHSADRQSSPDLINLRVRSLNNSSLLSPKPSTKKKLFDLNRVCEEGCTFLWDLVQDKNAQIIPEKLLKEAEKQLCGLVCHQTDEFIKTKFVEGCLNNLKSNRSCIISLKLLPKILSSFATSRTSQASNDIFKAICLFDDLFQMMSIFFRNLKQISENYVQLKAKNEYDCDNEDNEHLMPNMQHDVQVRLNFLTYLFSNLASPKKFELNMEQIETLWDSIIVIDNCKDDLFNWFLNQAKNKDQHAMNIETFKLIFMNKIPLLEPNSFTPVALHLYQELFKIYKYSYSNSDSFKLLEASAMDYIGKLAFKSANTEVSVSAIHFLNSHYVQCEHITQKQEEEFVNRCMFYLNEACAAIEQDTESSMMVLQRGLLLLKNHLDLFTRRFSYQLKLWSLQGTGVISHFKALQDSSLTQVNLICHVMSTSHKFSVKMNLSDCVGDLKASIVDVITNNIKASSSNSDEIQKLLESDEDFSVKLTINGQEMTQTLEARALSELQIKDNQSILVSIHSKCIQLSPGNSFIINPQNSTTKPSSTSSSSVLKLSHETVPMLILSNEPHFSNLFHLLNVLSQIKDTRFEQSARALGQKTWEVIMLLPTNKTLLEKYLQPTLASISDIAQIQQDSYKLLYNLQILEIISKFYDDKSCSSIASSVVTSTVHLQNNIKSEYSSWKQIFIDQGLLKVVYSLFKTQMSRAPQAQNDAFLDCLLVLLKLITLSLIENKQSESAYNLSRQELSETPRKKAKRNNNQRPTSDVIPSLAPLKENGLFAIDLFENDIDQLISLIFTLQTLIANVDYQNKNFIKIEILFYSMQLLSSCLGTQSSTNINEFGDVFREKFCQHTLKAQRILWLKSLILDCSDSIFRKEACTWIYRLCILIKSSHNMLIIILNDLITLLNVAVKFNIVSFDSNGPKALEYKPKTKGSSIFGVTCKDYFFLITTLIQNMSLEENQQAHVSVDNEEHIDFDNLIYFVAINLRERDYYENVMGANQIENEILVGLLSLGIALMKHNPSFKSNNDLAKGFIRELYDYLFELPTPSKKYLPKCKSTNSRSLCYDLLIELVRDNYDNYKCLHEILAEQHTHMTHVPYAWDYWPRDDVRSSCGYVGLTNLGATCYLATSLQHLFMIPEARNCLLKATCSEEGKQFEGLLSELQKMFAFLLESERKSYSPKNFCKNYIMDNQQLNTTEQKDMTEFFTDLISKIEEMSPELKNLVKTQFGGKITNLVISLDCPHVSSVIEEFYTVRCQVAGMKDLYDSLNEITVKDTLEGDNMYTCSKCGKKVRAEKRACFRKLPKIICFNTMRYTFNMVTMLKEKVNTHFSFPLQLDMSGYMEKNLYTPEKLTTQASTSTSMHADEQPLDDDQSEDDTYAYELIGVTVHTGTAEGGHYYSFIRDRSLKDEFDQDKWYLFNDAEVKQFDLSQLPSECFGGETTSKTYDSSNDRFMDLSFEKTHSAYMLFYEKVKQVEVPTGESVQMDVCEESTIATELLNWIWQDNTHFIHDRNTFEHSYFNFIWQMCDYIPRLFFHSHSKEKVLLNNLNLLATKLGTSFILETYIHAKEKPSMLQWIELLTKYFNGNKAACKWILEYMHEDVYWAGKVFLKCPNSTIRQMFQRLLLHVINRIKIFNVEEQNEIEIEEDKACVRRFLGRLLELINLNTQTTRFNIRYMCEFFMFLHEYARAGAEECKNLIESGTISKCVKFYLAQRARALRESGRDTPSASKLLSSGSDDETSDIIPLQDQKSKSKVFDKIISLISLLVEQNHDRLSLDDRQALIGDHEEMTFIYRAILDDRNLHYVRNIIYTLVKYEPSLSTRVIDMIFDAIKKHNNASCAQFFNMLGNSTMGLLEYDALEHVKLDFVELIVKKLHLLLDQANGYALQWLAHLVTCKQNVREWMFENLKLWVQPYLIGHKQTNIRFNAAILLANLIPNKAFRESYASNRSMFMPFVKSTSIKQEDETPFNLDLSSNECRNILHSIIECLLSYIGDLAQYTDKEPHSNNNRLVQYFTFLIYCMIDVDEKLLFKAHVCDLWNVFFTAISNIHTVNNINKQAALHLLYHALNGCQENVAALLGKAKIERELPLVTVAVDHEDSDLISYNRNCLHPYYATLRLTCAYSRDFTRQMSTHNNFTWAFKHILPYYIHYPLAAQELNKCVELFLDTVDSGTRHWRQFVDSFLNILMHDFDPKTCWQSILLILKTFTSIQSACVLVATHKKVMSLLSISFFAICMMHQEATACNVQSDLVECMHLMCLLLEKVSQLAQNDINQQMTYWKEKIEVSKRLILLLNFFNNIDLRTNALELLTFITKLTPTDTLMPLIHQLHNQYSIVNLITSNSLCNVYGDRKTTGHQTSIHLNFMGQYFPILRQKPIREPDSRVDERIRELIDDYNQHYHFYMPTSFASSNLIRFTKPMFNFYLPITHLSHTHISNCVFIDDDDYKKNLCDIYVPYFKFFSILCELAIENNVLTKELVNLMLVVSQHGLILGKNVINLVLSSNEAKKHALESPSLYGFLNSLILDFRIEFEKQEICDFIMFSFENESILSKFDVKLITNETCEALKEANNEYILYFDELMQNIDDFVVRKHTLFNFKMIYCHIKLLSMIISFKPEFLAKVKDTLEVLGLDQLTNCSNIHNAEDMIDEDKQLFMRNLLESINNSCVLLKQNIFKQSTSTATIADEQVV